MERVATWGPRRASGYASDEYLKLIDEGVLGEDDHVELLDGVMVPFVPDGYASEHPSRAHVVFEVADSSLLQDRLTKGPIYAKNGVPQYVLVNLRDRCVENHTAPSTPRRRYLERTILAAGEQLRLVAFPDVRIAVDDLLSSRPRR